MTPQTASTPRRKPAHTARRVSAVLSASAFVGIVATLAIANPGDGAAAAVVGTPGSSVQPGQVDGLGTPQQSDQFDPFAGQRGSPTPFVPTAPPQTTTSGS